MVVCLETYKTAKNEALKENKERVAVPSAEAQEIGRELQKGYMQLLSAFYSEDQN